MSKNESYLGDGVYIEIDNDQYHLKLSTKASHEVQTIYLDPDVAERLYQYLDKHLNKES